jgi:uncharacterized protein YutE (UPF0331/DUF86 family)
MVNPSVITRRVEQIEKHLERIRPFASLSHEAFLKDNVAQDVVEYNLFQIVNHLIDIFQHTVVDEEYGFPETAYEAAQILFEKGILSKEDVEVFKQMLLECSTKLATGQFMSMYGILKTPINRNGAF